MSRPLAGKDLRNIPAFAEDAGVRRITPIVPRKAAKKQTVAIDKRVSAKLDDLLEASPNSKNGLASAVLWWFVQQPEEIRALVAGYVPESLMMDCARNVLKRMERGEYSIKVLREIPPDGGHHPK